MVPVKESEEHLLDNVILSCPFQKDRALEEKAESFPSLKHLNVHYDDV